MMMATFVALVESTGGFIAVARYASATPLPPSILSRGVGWQEGLVEIHKDYIEEASTETVTHTAISEKSPPENFESENLKSLQAKAESFLSSSATEESESNSTSPQNNVSSQQNTHSKTASISEFKMEKQLEDARTHDTVGAANESNGLSVSNTKDGGVQPSTDSGSKSKSASADERKEVIEQFEPGVYVTLIPMGNGAKIFKRVKFR